MFSLLGSNETLLKQRVLFCYPSAPSLWCVLFLFFKCFGSGPCLWHYFSSLELRLEECFLASLLLLTGWLLCAGLLPFTDQGLRDLETSTGLSIWLQYFLFRLLTKNEQGFKQLLLALNTVLPCLFSLHVHYFFPLLANNRINLEKKLHFLPVYYQFLSSERWHNKELGGVRENV